MGSVKHIGIIGGGLVGSLLSIYLAKRGYIVSVYERRPDPRVGTSDDGRSINLALSNRGIRALHEVGLSGKAGELSIPMHGRMMHDPEGNLTFLPYGKQGQYINSISRSALNTLLLDNSEKEGVRFFFRNRCISVNLEETRALFQTADAGDQLKSFDVLIGADGAFSAVRSAMQVTDRFNYSQHYLEHGYKELEIPPTRLSTGMDFAMDKNALHIWPRESFMMIALPNPDGSFTSTLFLPFEGQPSFRSVQSDGQIEKFFRSVFPDALPHMTNLLTTYRTNPVSSLVTIKCFPWVRNKSLLIGDAAHGIVPFYGQGMNAGFEDCRILNELLNDYRDDWDIVLDHFQNLRKEDTDAISELAVDNFIEMRDLVADSRFLLRKKIEARLHELFPDRWIPLYSMVTFNDGIRYSHAYHMGKKQARIMDEVMETPQIDTSWPQLDFKKIVDRLS